jgi:hypothetical protein
MLKLAVLKLAMKSPEVLGRATELIEEIQSVGLVMSREERSRLLSRYWALVRAVQAG